MPLGPRVAAAAWAPTHPTRLYDGDGAGSRLATTGRMRFFAVTLVVSLLSLPVAAHPHKRTHARSHPARAQPKPTVVPNDRQAQEHARAEAELSDLRAGNLGNDGADAQTDTRDMPQQTWAVQENDREIPANLRQKK